MERKGATPSRVKLIVADDVSLKNLVQKAITKLVDNAHPTADETERAKHHTDAHTRVKSMSCADSDLTEFAIDDPDATLKAAKSLLKSRA